MKYIARALIFDLDGTLLDSLEDIADAANAALTDAGYAPHPLDAYRHFVGNGLKTLMRRTVPENVDETAIAALHEGMARHYENNWRNKTRPYAGVPQMLEHLSGHGLPMAVLSNKAHFFAEMIIRHFFPMVPFVRVQGKTETGKAKPDPAMALTIAGDMGVRPEHIAFVGDSGVDMDTAVAAEMLPVGVLWGFRSEEELLAHGACRILRRPLEIMDICNPHRASL
jgi:phosphoglycolate phosphatase